MHRPHVGQQSVNQANGKRVSKGKGSAPASKKPREPYSKPGSPKLIKNQAKTIQRICYVLDTNVLIDDPQSPFAFDEHDVVIPLVVFEELDHLKSKLPQAREAIRALYELGISEDWTQLQSGGRLRAESGRGIQNVPGIEGNNDNRIISIAVGLDQKFGPNNKETGKYRSVVLVSNDLNVGVKSRILGLKTELYKTNEARKHIGDEQDTLPKVMVSAKELDMMLKNSNGDPSMVSLVSSVRDKIDAAEIPVNSGVLVYLDGSKESLQFGAVYKGDHLVRTDSCNATVWNNGIIKPYVPTYWQERGVTANHEQEVYLQALFDRGTTLVSAYGRAGTGKTLQAVAVGLKLVLDGQYDKILITKPQVASGPEIGFLPGTKEEKMAAWVAPMRDHLVNVMRQMEKSQQEAHAQKSHPGTKPKAASKRPQKGANATASGMALIQQGTTGGQSGTDSELFDSLLTSGKLEIEATQYVRGRSLERTFVVIDEGQNLSVAEMKTWVTRIGEGAKLVVTGDIEQIDHLHLRANNNGLAVLADRSRVEPWAFSVHLIYGVRSVMSDWAANNL
jgi:PhoH-like ATPase